MRRHAFLALVLFASCADERAPANRGAVGRGAEVGASASAPAEVARDPFSPGVSGFVRARSRRDGARDVARAGITAAPSGVVTAPAPAPTSPPGEQRDHAAELRASFGNPASCFSAPSALPDRVAVSVSVVVSTSGRVTRAEVSAPGLPAQDADCLRARALGMQLPQVDDAPLPVRAVLEVERRPSAPPGPANAP